MNFIAYCRDKFLLLTLHFSCMAALAAFLYVTDYPAANIGIVLLFWLLILSLWFLWEFLHRRLFFARAEEILTASEQKYLLGELMPESFRLEDQLYRDMIRRSNKSVIERIRSLEDAQKEYREYIETWVHEVKAPIACISLLCEKLRQTPEQAPSPKAASPEIPSPEAMKSEHPLCDTAGDISDESFPHSASGGISNEGSSHSAMCGMSGNESSHSAMYGMSNKDSARSAAENPSRENRSCPAATDAPGGEFPYPPGTSPAEIARRILQENRKTENFVDMALFYARSDEVYKDYLIKETTLQQAAEDVLRKNKYYLIQSRIYARVDCPDTVYTDVKWISFILNQLILNAVKYRRDPEPEISIFTEKTSHGVRLTVADNGLGIPEEDLPRIFDKGFTGSNGRAAERSTGMGLYLCRKLCGKLGIGICAQSAENAGTRISLEFPVSSYLSKL